MKQRNYSFEIFRLSQLTTKDWPGCRLHEIKGNFSSLTSRSFQLLLRAGPEIILSRDTETMLGAYYYDLSKKSLGDIYSVEDLPILRLAGKMVKRVKAICELLGCPELSGKFVEMTSLSCKPILLTDIKGIHVEYRETDFWSERWEKAILIRKGKYTAALDLSVNLFPQILAKRNIRRAEVEFTDDEVEVLLKDREMKSIGCNNVKKAGELLERYPKLQVVLFCNYSEKGLRLVSKQKRLKISVTGKNEIDDAPDLVRHELLNPIPSFALVGELRSQRGTIPMEVDRWAYSLASQGFALSADENHRIPFIPQSYSFNSNEIYTPDALYPFSIRHDPCKFPGKIFTDHFFNLTTLELR